MVNSKINLARLDTRLLHGQVATNWTPASKADRIIVASDDVAKDELRKLIKQAAPNGVKQTLFQFKNWLILLGPSLCAYTLILFKAIQDTSCYRRWRANQKELNTLVLWLTQLVKQWLTTFLSMDKDDVALLRKNYVTLALNSTSVRYQTILRKICSTLSK